MEILLTGCSILIGGIIAFLLLRAKLQLNKELEIDILKETTDCRILIKIEAKGLISTFNAKADYLKLAQGVNGIWLLKTRGLITGSGYATSKLVINKKVELTSMFNFRLLNLQIEKEEGKMTIENSSLNRVVLTFRINNEKDIELLTELQNSIK